MPYLYTAFVLPHLEYAQSVWSPYITKFIDALENVQIRATKLVDGFGNLEYLERPKKPSNPTILEKAFQPYYIGKSLPTLLYWKKPSNPTILE